MLVYPDVRAAVDWLTAVFGFVERTRIGESHRSQMSIGSDGAVIVVEAGANEAAPTAGVVTQSVRVRVEDANKLSDAIAANLQIPVEEKQELLELFDPLERLNRIADILEVEIEKLNVDRTLVGRRSNSLVAIAQDQVTVA